jgi:hypothetical protein
MRTEFQLNLVFDLRDRSLSYPETSALGSFETSVSIYQTSLCHLLVYQIYDIRCSPQNPHFDYVLSKCCENVVLLNLGPRIHLLY